MINSNRFLMILTLIIVLLLGINTPSFASNEYTYTLPKGYKEYDVTGNTLFSIAKESTCSIMLQKSPIGGKITKNQLALYTPESMIQLFEIGFIDNKLSRADGSYLELLSTTTAKETTIGKNDYYSIQVDAELADHGYTYDYPDFYARNYYLFSENFIYILTFQSLNKSYFDSKETKDFLNSLEIKESIVFNQKDKDESIANSNNPPKEINTDIKCIIPEGFVEQELSSSYLFNYVKYKEQLSYIICGYKTHLDEKITIENIKSIDASIAYANQFDSTLKNRKDTNITLISPSICIPTNIGKNDYTTLLVDSHYNESNNGVNVEVYAYTYMICSPTDMYCISIATTDKDYFWTNEFSNFLKTIACKDSTVFTKADEQIIEKNAAPGYNHFIEYPDYIGIYVFSIVLAVIMYRKITQNNKKVSLLWLVIVLLGLGLLSIIGLIYEKREIQMNFNVPSLVGYIGYFWPVEIALIILVVQIIKTKNKKVDVKNSTDKIVTKEKIESAYNTINNPSPSLAGMGSYNPIKPPNEKVKLDKDNIPWELQESGIEETEFEVKNDKPDEKRDDNIFASADYELNDNFKAIDEVQKIKNGGVGHLSLAQITNLIINMVDAKNNLDSDSYNKVYSLFTKMNTCTTKLEMDSEGYIANAVDIIKRFDAIAPYEKYSGGNEIEFSFLMDEIRNNDNQELFDVSNEESEYSKEIAEKSLGMITDDEAKTFVKILTESISCSKLDTLKKVDTLYKSLNNKYGIFYLLGALNVNKIIDESEVKNLQNKYKSIIIPNYNEINNEQTEKSTSLNTTFDSKTIKLDELLEITYNGVLKVDGGVKGVIKSVSNLIRSTAIYEEWHIANTRTMYLDSDPKYMIIANKRYVLEKIKKLDLDSLVKRQEKFSDNIGFCRLTTVSGKKYDIPFKNITEEEMNIILDIMNNECTEEISSKFVDKAPLIDYTKVNLKNKITNLEIIKILLSEQKLNQLFDLINNNCTCYIKESGLKLLGDKDIRKYIKKTIGQIKHQYKSNLEANICGFYNINEPDIMLEVYHYLPGSFQTKKRFVQLEFENNKVSSITVLDDINTVTKNLNEKAIELLKKGRLNEFNEDIANEVNNNDVTWNEFLEKNYSLSKGNKTYFSTKE